jgi:hypothetical protein
MVFRNIAKAQDEQLSQGGGNNMLLYLVDTLNCTNSDWQNLELFTMWFKGNSVPSSANKNRWLEQEGITDAERSNRKKRYQYRTEYCMFNRAFIIPILERITASNGDNLCVDRSKQEILRSAAAYLHKFLFKGRVNFAINEFALKQLPTPEEIYNAMKEYDTTSANNKAYWENNGYEKHKEKKRKKNAELTSKVLDDVDSPLVYR